MIPRVARFLSAYLTYPRNALQESEVPLPNTEGGVATFIRPDSEASVPGWVLLHGVTVPGRSHPVLRRFAHAIAGSGAAVIIPEVPAWKQLHLDSRAGDAGIDAAIDYLRNRRDVGPDLSMMGFSFGATQALISAARPTVQEQLSGIVGFGGYADLGRSMRFMLTGEHEWEGVQRRLEPDPYGRWVVVGNYIDRIPQYAHLRGLKRAAYELALESGRRGVYAADASYEPRKEQLRADLTTEERRIWDLIAPPPGRIPDRDASRELADQLTAAALTHDPTLDPTSSLPRLQRPVVLAHGQDDRLIPYTETLRLGGLLSASAQPRISITRLFSHSRGAERLRLADYPGELIRYLQLLHNALSPGSPRRISQDDPRSGGGA